MSLNHITETLDKIRSELTTQISLAKNTDKIDITTLSKQSKTPNQIIPTFEISNKDKSILQKFSLTLQEDITAKNLKYEKQDLGRIISNLND